MLLLSYPITAVQNNPETDENYKQKMNLSHVLVS